MPNGGFGMWFAEQARKRASLGRGDTYEDHLAGDPYVAMIVDERDWLREQIVTLKAENARLRRENDALMADLRGDCASCVHRDESAKSDVCQTCPQPGGAGFGNWEWRGPREDAE